MDIKNKRTKKILKYTLGMAALFFVMAGLGVLSYRLWTAETTTYVERLVEEFRFFEDLSFYGFFLVIFLNNSLKVFISILLGVIFGIIPLFFIGFNGFVLGLISAYTFPELGITGLFFSLFFHGVFELLAVFIGGALGLHLGVTFYKELKEKNLTLGDFRNLKKIRNNSRLWQEFKFSMDTFLYICLPLLLLAAVIEAILLAVVL